MTETQLRALCEQLRADLKEAKRKLAVMPAPRAIRDTVIRLIREYSRTFGCSEEDTADAIIAALSASPAAPSQEGWQPIETHPQGDDDFMVGDCRALGGNMVVVGYDPGDGKSDYVFTTGDISYHRDAFTHWRPLPNLPGDEAPTP